MERLGPDGLRFADFRNGFLFFEKEFGRRYHQWVEDASR
jgi:hypothetical protein